MLVKNNGKTIYSRYVKRIIDFLCALFALILFSPLLIVLAVMVRIKLGGPVIFKQQRPGYKGRIFTMYKFRTMSNERDGNGKLLPDGKRLTSFGKWLRSTSMDELPELFNILKGDMSIVGPRPQLIKDMIFMTEDQKRRHCVRQGLTGLAQINGRNNITWEDKLEYDLEYIEKITFKKDVLILFKTFSKIVKKDGVNTDGMDTAEDFGDYLLHSGKISQDYYVKKLQGLEQSNQYKDWCYYNHAYIPTTPPHQSPNLLPVLSGDIWKNNKKALLVRWTDQFDNTKETEWWYCIKNDQIDLNKMTSKQRYEVNKGLKNMTVEMADPLEFEEPLYQIAVDCFVDYPVEYRGSYSKETHHNACKEWKKEGITFIAKSNDNNDILGYAVCRLSHSGADLIISKVPHKYQRYGTNAALVYAVCEEILNRRHLDYICDGSRNIRHQTNYQEYLVKYFGFRKVYCRLNIEYRSYMKILIKVLYPFRRIFRNSKNHFFYNVYCILKQEEIRRSF